MNDLISRQDAIDAVNKYYNNHKYIKRSLTILSAICLDMKNMIEKLPSAELRPLSDDEAETICIIVKADIEEMCRQHRWDEAKKIEQALDKVIYISTKLETLPSAEPQIIRCKDCKWYAERADFAYCSYHDDDILWMDDDYCSYATRRTE